MTPTNLQLVTSVIHLTNTVIQNHMREQSELLDLFNKASSENRDLTSEEVAMFRAKAEQAVANIV